jgi:hypothetical protein
VFEVIVFGVVAGLLTVCGGAGIAGAAMARWVRPRRLRRRLLARPVPIRDLAKRKGLVVVSGRVRPAGRTHRTPFGDVEVVGYRVTVTAIRGRRRIVFIDRATFEPFSVEDGSGGIAVVRPKQPENLMIGPRYRLLLAQQPVLHATFDDLATRTDLRGITQQLHRLAGFERFEYVECILREGDTATVSGEVVASTAVPGMGYRDRSWQVEITDPLIICNRTQEWLRNQKDILADVHELPPVTSFN